jgi:hypothetical protein
LHARQRSDIRPHRSAEARAVQNQWRLIRRGIEARRIGRDAPLAHQGNFGW